MERGALVAKARLARAQLLEVLRRLRDSIAVEAEYDAARLLATDGDVKVHLQRSKTGSLSQHPSESFDALKHPFNRPLLVIANFLLHQSHCLSWP